MTTTWSPLSLSSVLDDRTQRTVDHLFAVGFGIVEAIVVYLIAWLVSRWIRRPLRRRLAKTDVSPTLQGMLDNVWRICVFLVATVILFGTWGLTLSGFLAAVSVSTIILALGFQTALQSFLAGAFIVLERPFGVGDRIRFSGQDIEGVVTEIGVRSLVLTNDRGERITAPNALIFSLGVTNLSPSRSQRTVVRVNGLSLDESRARMTIAAAVALDPPLPAPSAVRFRSRLVRSRLPLGELSNDLPASISKMTRAVNRVRDADVIWTTALDAADAATAMSRLREAFPKSTVASVRR